MKKAFVTEAKVRILRTDGSLGELAEITPPPERNLETPPELAGYLGEGYYHVLTIPERRSLIVHEDDVILVEDLL